MNSNIYSLAFIEGLGGPELMMIFFVVLLLFGGQKLPELARGLGKSVREFKKATAGVEEEIKKAMEAPAETEKPKLETKPAAEPNNPFIVPPPEK
jgi:TatA/E family protein of Tat protein translocase